MAIPLIYNLRSLRERWTSSLVAVLGIAGTVGVFVAVLSLARGFKATVVSSGSARNAIVMRAGATSEMTSAVAGDDVHAIENAPDVARAAGGEPLISPEVVVIASFPLKSTGTNAGVQIRGVSSRALAVHDRITIASGRLFSPGLNELVIGRNVERTYEGFRMGQTVAFGGGTWTVVGVLDAGGSGFDSEIWCDASVLSQIYKRPQNIFQSVTVRLNSPAALAGFKDSLTIDPRLNLQVERETDYYEKESRQLTSLITVLGGLVAMVMGIGAVFGALNTMYSAVAQRAREIATMRAVGFGAGSVVTSFLFEALCVAFLGWLLGCICILPLNGLTTATMNFQTFSQIAFAFRITPLVLITGLAFAFLMGVVGGVPPAIRAARARIAGALREL
jgi:putative ABC transport system permease protein